MCRHRSRVIRALGRFTGRFACARSGSVVSEHALTVSLCTCGSILVLAGFGIGLDDVIDFAIQSLSDATGLVFNDDPEN